MHDEFIYIYNVHVSTCIFIFTYMYLIDWDREKVLTDHIVVVLSYFYVASPSCLKAEEISLQ